MGGKKNDLHVQFGCGLDAPPQWINFDSSLRLRLERFWLTGQIMQLTVGKIFPESVMYGNIVKGLPFDNCAATAVFCSHVLEHLTSEECDIALNEVSRILKPNGIFRCVVPDLRARIDIYKKGISASAADDFMRSTLLGMEKRPKRLAGRVRAAVGNSAHLWMFDYESLSSRLKVSGFRSIRRCQFGDSNHHLFAYVEKRERFFEDSFQELAIEAIK
ncbi:methyltransferase domain-containing protein [Methylocystis sp. ATCC 49242]|uniref:class I SAM-dependent methyltransferase n=1 Tax=Methylocystis sp. ATCC 49242 TaxID=622637 RepID=UPI0001F87177|nr:methyltransferase domain-containing protein [Methylocystis sp. ATCC 49242]